MRSLVRFAAGVSLASILTSCASPKLDRAYLNGPDSWPDPRALPPLVDPQAEARSEIRDSLDRLHELAGRIDEARVGLRKKYRWPSSAKTFRECEELFELGVERLRELASQEGWERVRAMGADELHELRGGLAAIESFGEGIAVYMECALLTESDVAWQELERSTRGALADLSTGHRTLVGVLEAHGDRCGGELGRSLEAGLGARLQRSRKALRSPDRPAWQRSKELWRDLVVARCCSDLERARLRLIRDRGLTTIEEHPWMGFCEFLYGTLGFLVRESDPTGAVASEPGRSGGSGIASAGSVGQG